MGLLDAIGDAISGTSSQLLNEKHQASLTGNEDAISMLKKMDRQVGKLMKPFNGVARVPPDVVMKIEKLIAENAKAMTLVNATQAYEQSRTERLGNFLRNDKGTTAQPIRWLEYENVFTSPTGGRIEQRVAQFRVGP